MAQQVKDLVLSLLWLKSMLLCGLDPWPGNFHMPQAQLKKKKNRTLELFNALFNMTAGRRWGDREDTSLVTVLTAII